MQLQNLFQLRKYPLLTRHIQNSATVSLWNGPRCRGPPVTSSQPKMGTLSLKPWWPIPQALWRAWRLPPRTKSQSDPSALQGRARPRLQSRQRQVAGCHPLLSHCPWPGSDTQGCNCLMQCGHMSAYGSGPRSKSHQMISFGDLVICGKGDIDWLIDFKVRRGGGREREPSICCPTYLCIHGLFLVCTLTGDQTHNLGVSRWCSNQMSYPARARRCI